MIAAVVFDLDGVLVDSEELAWDAWRLILASHHIRLRESEIGVLTGRTEKDAYDYFAARGELPPYEEFQAELAAAITSRFSEHLSAFADAENALSELGDRGVRLAVASSSPRSRLDLALRRTGLERLVELTVAGDEVSAGKPAPEIYLAAARLLGIDPADCLAVEDTPAGIEAAKAAGMRVMAVERGRYPRAELEGADQIVEHLDPELLTQG